MAKYIVTGATVPALATLGLVFVPQNVAPMKASKTFEYLWSPPIPRAIFLLADFTLWAVVVLPGVIVTLVVGPANYGFELAISPLVVPAFLLVALTAVAVGMSIAHLSPSPVLTGAVSNIVVFLIFFFSPINFPLERLPDWLATVHQVLPIMYMADLVRGTVTDGLVKDLGLAFLVVALWCPAGLVALFRVFSRRSWKGECRAMNEQNQAKEVRDVRGFASVALRDFGRLVITQGEEESLTIEAAGDLLKKVVARVSDGQLILGVEAGWLDKVGQALTAALIRKPVTYNLVVKELEGLEILGGALVEVTEVTTEQLSLVILGAGSIRLRSLTAERLVIDLRGTGKIEVDGRVREQQVTLSGAGVYLASGLDCADASVSLTGAGNATVRATDTLDVIHSGFGKVGYFGSPTVSKKVTGLGTVSPLGG